LLIGSAVLRVLRQPSVNQFSLKSPLVADFKRWKTLSRQQPIDGEFVDVEVFGNLLKRKQGLRGVVNFFHTLANDKARSAPSMKDPEKAQ
jgi:hypothetical protein